MTEECAQCSAGYTLLNRKCIKQSVGCIYSNGICASCNPPFQYDQANQVCYISGCNQLSDNGCVNCAAPFVLNNQNNCVIANCALYNKNSCLNCVDGFKLSNGLCLTIDSNCITWQG